MSLCRTLSRIVAFPFLAALFAHSAAATTFARVSDENLVAGASAIAVGRLLSIDDTVGIGGSGIPPSTDYRFALESRLKGWLPGATLTVRVPGGRAPGGLRQWIPGAPQFRVGERALLFLEPARNGVRRLEQFLQGAFHEVGPEGARLALRDLSGAVEWKLIPSAFGPRVAEGGEAEAPRDFSAFVRWIRQRSAGKAMPANYRLDPARAEVRSIVEKYVLTTAGDGRHVRWFDFDGGGSVPWRTAAGAQSGVADGGVPEAQAGMGAWNSDPATSIRYAYAGTTSAASGLLAADGTNTILWNNPNHEFPPFSCDTGGFLAMSAPWYTNATTDFQGTPYHTIVEGDVVVNSGVECIFAGEYGPTHFSELMGHELGHTLGLEHSSDINALMYIYIQFARGINLGSDDLAAISCLYAGSCGGEPTPPVPPTGLAAAALAFSEVQLSWTDNSHNETGYRVEMRLEDGSFSEVASLTSDTASTIVGGLVGGTTYVFRVRATGSGAQFSAYSNEATATTPEGGGVPPNAPSDLIAVPLSSSRMRLNWSDNASDETGFRIEARFSQGSYLDVGGAAANASSAQVTGLLPATTYFFRVRAYAGAGFSAYSNEAHAQTLETAGPCTPAANTLCLDGGRFRVSVAWQQSGGTTGVGTVVPSLTTSDSGAFWFFAESNWEMLVKVLDGCAVNHRHWVFFGAATNQGYSVTVTDTATGQSKTYRNPLGTVAPILTDTDAFDSCP